MCVCIRHTYPYNIFFFCKAIFYCSFKKHLFICVAAVGLSFRHVGSLAVARELLVVAYAIPQQGQNPDPLH